jgi:hypothetical protein
MTKGLAHDASRFYEAGDDAAVLSLAEENWPALDGELTPAHAEVAYFARTVAYRTGDHPAVRLWGARAMVASVLSRSLPTAARLLLPDFFALLEAGESVLARTVLKEMGRLVEIDPEVAAEGQQVLARLYHEKLATSYLLDSDPREAATHYEIALRGTRGDSRGGLKVQGGIELARFLAEPSDDAREHLQSELRRIAEHSRHRGFPDVQGIAQHNLRWLEGNEDDWRPFELL